MLTIKSSLKALCVSSLFAISAAQAGPILIENHSFEMDDCDVAGTCHFNQYTNGQVTGWDVTGSAGVLKPSAVPGANRRGYHAPDGDQGVYSNGGSLTQTLTHQLLDKTLYTLTIDVGERADYPGVTDYEVGLYAGDALLKRITRADFSPLDGWLTANFSYNSTGSFAVGEQLRIRLSSAGGQTNFDNVRLNAVAVPEPGALSLLGLGILGLFFSRRKRAQMSH